MVFWFSLALLVRILYGISAPTIIYGPDSSGYYSIGKEMVLVHPYRTPLYPFFIHAVFYSMGLGNIAEGAPGFDRALAVVVAIQMIIGAAAFAIFARSINKWLALFLVFDVFTFGWERSILTEGLAVSFMLITTAVLFHILQKPTKQKFIILFILFTLGFLLRPALLTIPIAALPILAWHFRKKTPVVMYSIVTLVCFLLVPLTYAQINKAVSGYNGIQIVGDIDILGRILETKLPIDSAKQYEYFYTTVRDYQTKNLTPHPFRFLEFYDPNIYGKMERFNELHRFNQTVILNNSPAFLLNMVKNITNVLLEINMFTPAPPLLKALYGNMQYLTLLIPFLWIVEMLFWLKKPTRERSVIMLLGTIVMSQILLTAAVVYKDYGGQYQRLLAPIRPQMFLFLILSFYEAQKALLPQKATMPEAHRRRAQTR